MIKPELLAPAGDLERLKIALIYGADAVYIGGSSFNLRANAINFGIEEIKEGVEFAHNINKKVYVTVNIILHNEDVGGLLKYLKKLDKLGVDAIIVSDAYIIKLALDNTNLEVHLSTQASTLNYEAALFYKEQGVKRIVLARECTKEDIKEILLKSNMQIETFIHGAMCACYSGRCVMSNFLTNRDANRGGCSQICRWDFNLLDENKRIIKGEKPFTFCTKDLSMLKHIKEMINMGISSFKIEGRMRSVYYIATVVSIYRKIIDMYCKHPLKLEYNVKDEIVLRNCANRDSIVQFFDGNYDHSCSYYNGRVEISNQDFLGIIIDYNKKTHEATIEQRNYFKKGDIVEIFGPNHNIIEYTFSDIIDEENNLIEIVNHPKQIVRVKMEKNIEKLDMIRIRKNAIDKKLKM